MENLQQIPSEIKKYIVSFMDHNTKLRFRAMNMQWFKFIDYRDFTLYFTRGSDLPSISKCLSRYQVPISLSFKKQKEPLKFEEFAAEIAKVTTLTGLDLPEFDGLQKTLDVGKEYLALSALSNLKTLNNSANDLQTRGYDVVKIAKNFRNLTSLQVPLVYAVTDHYTHSMEDVAPIIKQNHNLVELNLSLRKPAVDQHFVDTFMNNKMLTKLTINYDQIQYHACNMYSVLSGLKELNIQFTGYTNTDERDVATWAQLTNLESLSFHSRTPLANIHQLVNLTYLSLSNGVTFESEWAKVCQSLTALSKLKHVVLALQERDATQYEFLSAFTELESLSITRTGREPEMSFLQRLNSPHLTQLQIYSLSPVSLEGPFPSLMNVRELHLKLRQAVDNVTLETLLASMPHLTKLIYEPVSNGNDVKVLEKLSNLRVLVYENGPAGPNGTKMSLQQLINLEELDVNALVEPSDLQYCPHLTSLQCNINTEPGTDYKYLASLPLKALSIGNAVTDNHLFRAVGQLIGLECLHVTALEDEHVTLFSGLANLTKLAGSQSPKFTGATLGPLTALQELDFYTAGQVEKPDLYPVQALNLPYLQSVQNSSSAFSY